MEKTMDKIVALAKSRGFVYPGSEIYGGLANTWDYGNLGVELKNNVKRAWWQKFIQENPYNVGVDCAILMNPQTWVASGHLGGFSDPLMDCKECHERFRADKIIEDFAAEKNIELKGSVDGWTQEEMRDFIEEHQIPCPTCGKHNFTDIRQFNLMFKTFQGVTEDAKNTVYLRPETAQGIFVNFKNVQRTSRKKIPFGIGQIGKSFRNEITPGNFTFRTREFEQMELEFFCEPGTDLEWFQYWRAFCRDWLLTLGIKEDEMRLRDHDPEELSFYSKGTTDIEFLFPFGWGELWGIADRTDYDLTRHQNTSPVRCIFYLRKLECQLFNTAECITGDIDGFSGSTECIGWSGIFFFVLHFRDFCSHNASRLDADRILDRNCIGKFFYCTDPVLDIRPLKALIGIGEGFIDFFLNIFCFVD